MASLPSGRADSSDRRAHQLEALKRVVLASTPRNDPSGCHTAHPWSRRRARQIDALAGLVLVLLGGWSVVAAIDRPAARAEPVLLLVIATGVVGATGRAIGHRAPLVVPGVVAVAIGGAFVLTFPDVMAAGGAPTGYGNANACLAALGATAASASSALAANGSVRRCFAALALLLVAAVVATASVAGMLIVLMSTALAAAALVTRQVAIAVLGGLVVVSLSLGVTAAIAEGSGLLGLGDRSGERAALWVEAIRLTAEDSLRGVGTGTFGARSSVSADADLRWAHHDYLQQAAEQGVVGLSLLLALVGCGVARLWIGRRSRVHTVTGAAALTVVALHASVDHVLAHGAVPLTLAVLIGWASGDRRITEDSGRSSGR